MLASRRTLVFGCAFAASLLAALAPAVASAGILQPGETGSESASTANVVIAVTFIITTIVVLAAIGAFVASLRRAGGAETVATPSTGTEIKLVGGVGAAALVAFAIAVVATESVRAGSESDDAESITIEATAQQWLWRYSYPIPEGVQIANRPGIYSYYELVIPVNTEVNLELDSVDVIHNWSVPGLARQVDANPGDGTSKLTFVAEEVGAYEGRSNVFSGPGFTSMRTRVRVVEPGEYTAWINRKAEAIKEANAAIEEDTETGQIPGIPGSQDEVETKK